MKIHPVLAVAVMLTAVALGDGNVPPAGFTPLFNGKDLAGWWGTGGGNPKKFLSLTAEKQAEERAKALADIQKHWSVANGELINDGEGLYLTTEQEYGDFELFVEYKTVPLADSGIYLRGLPQVQIWDSTDKSKFELGADKGSGGLWNNSAGAPGKDPLVKADRPFGEWNKLHIIMVGEIRDFETSEISIRAAMTGHLVFSTLHTNDAVSGITRLLDMGIEPFLLASVVRCFLAQRLVRKICPDCITEAAYDADYLRENEFIVPPGTKLFRGKGCDSCRQTGYRGRFAIFEVCIVTEELRRKIIRKETGSALKNQAMADGMESLRTDGWRRVLKGQTTVEEVVRVTQADEAIAETG